MVASNYWLPGKKPACIQACTQGALQFGPIEELRKKYPKAVVAGYDWAAREFIMQDRKRQVRVS